MTSRWFLRKINQSLRASPLRSTSTEVSRHGALGNVKAQLHKLCVDSGSSPQGIFARHPLDQLTDLGTHPRPAQLPLAEKATANRAEIRHDATGRRSPASPPLAPPPSRTRRVAAKPRRLDPTRSTS